MSQMLDDRVMKPINQLARVAFVEVEAGIVCHKQRDLRNVTSEYRQQEHSSCLIIHSRSTDLASDKWRLKSIFAVLLQIFLKHGFRYYKL